MSEADIIAKTNGQPNTVGSLKQDLKKLGLTEGMTLIVHSSLSSLGWICGGIPTLILALEESIGEKGTLVMPAHSGDLSDPAEYKADYPAKKFINNGMPILENGTRQWRYFDDIEMDSEDFERIGSAYEEHHTVITGKLGQAECRLIQMQNLVDFAVDWMHTNRL